MSKAVGRPRKRIQDKHPDRPEAAYRLTDQIGHLLRRAYQRHTTIFQAIIPDDRLTAVQFAVLVTLRDDQGISLTWIGRMTGIDPATLRGIVARLLERQLIVIENNPDDRRERLISLSSAGSELVEACVPNAFEISEKTVAPLNECERIAAIFILKKLVEE